MEVLLVQNLETSNSDTRQCRICLEENEPFISPCNCTGSLKYVHRECLDTWRSIDTSQKRFYKCDICLTDFQFSIFFEKQSLVNAFFYLSILGHIILDLFLINCAVSGISMIVYLSDKNSEALANTFSSSEYVGAYLMGWIIFFAIIGLFGFFMNRDNDVIICINEGGLGALICFLIMFFTIGVFIGIYYFFKRVVKFSEHKRNQLKIYYNTKIYVVKDIGEELQSM